MISKGKLLLVLIGMLLYGYSLGICAPQAAAGDILIIHPGASTMRFQQLQNEGFLDYWDQYKARNRVFIEYRDSTRYPGREYDDEFVRKVADKYKTQHFSAIVAPDFTSDYYAERIRKELSQDCPIVAIAFSQHDITAEKNNFLFLQIDLQLENTLQLAKTLEPALRNILICASMETIMTPGAKDYIKATLQPVLGETEILYPVSGDMDEVVQQIAALSEKDAVLFLELGSDANGRRYDIKEWNRRLSPVNRAPIYSVQTILRPGQPMEGRSGTFVGGYLIDTYQVGQELAKLVIALEDGPSPAYVTPYAALNPTVDYHGLTRFGFEKKQLPPHAQVINKPFSFLESYWNLVVTVLAVLTVLLLFIGVLLINIRRRRNAEYTLEQNNQELMVLYNQILAGEQSLQFQHSELKLSEARFQLAIDASQNAIWDIDMTTMQYIVPPSWNSAVQLPSINTVAEFLQCIHPDDRRVRTKRLEEHLAGKTPLFEVEYRLRTRDNHWVWVLARGKAVRDERGIPYRLIGSLADISELKAREEALRQKDELFQAAAEAAQNGIYDVDLITGDIWLSDSWRNKIGIHKAEYKEFARMFVHPDDQPEREKSWLNAVNGNTRQYTATYRLRLADGQFIWVLSRGSILRDSTGTAIRFVGAMSDITYLINREEQIRYRATHDELSGLLNRFGFCEKLDKKLADQAGGAVMLFDIEELNLVNDVYGHESGDALICGFSRRLQEFFGEDALLGRHGGDEFSVFVPTQDLMQLEKISSTLANRYIDTAHGPFLVQIKTGVALTPEHGDNGSILAKKADMALNQVGKHGNTSRLEIYNDDMHHQMERRLMMRAALYHAVERAEFFLVYQPVYKRADNQMVISGFEALLRWRHPTLGLISPTELIPLAEETDQIIPIGDWVLAEACRFAQMYNEKATQSVRMSVNISIRQLLDDDFVSRLKDTVSASGLSPGLLMLEVTESIMMTDVKTCISRLEAIRRLGLRIALDDYGTGYSSLAYLQSLPLDVLKLDKAFVDELGGAKKRNETVLVDSTIRMAKELGYFTVAEGVETPVQLQELVNLGCDYFQGYLLSKPLEEKQALLVR